MKMRKKNMLFAFMVSVLVPGVLLQPGCKKTDLSLDSNLFHDWEWIETSGGFAGEFRTPGSEGYTQSLKFEKNGTYTKYKDNVVVERGTFTIITGQSILDHKEHDMVVFSNGNLPQTIFVLTEHELTLAEECIDCYTHRYRR